MTFSKFCRRAGNDFSPVRLTDSLAQPSIFFWKTRRRCATRTVTYGYYRKLVVALGHQGPETPQHSRSGAQTRSPMWFFSTVLFCALIGKHRETTIGSFFSQKKKCSQQSAQHNSSNSRSKRSVVLGVNISNR